MSAVVAVALLWLALIVPDRPAEMSLGQFLILPLELPPVLVGLMLARGWGLVAARILLAAVLVAMVALRLADLVSYAAFARPFNPALDRELIPAAVRLAWGALGALPTILIGLGLISLTFGLAFALWWAAGRVARLGPPGGAPRAALVAALALALVPLALDFAGRPVAFGAARTLRLAGEHLTAAVAASEDLERFRIEAEADPFAARPRDDILPALQGHDILIVFVESYGRAALEAPRYGPTINARLDEGARALEAAGLAARSGWLTAPMVGGQSWFAHGTLLSGLLVDSQARYDALMASPRLTLARLAQRAGWRSVAVMPAITYAWPEARYFGYDTVLASRDLDYAGKPFNWVTMPDQFTLASFERMALETLPRPPVIAEIALISSHAPWTPIPPLLPWEEIGDGALFDRWASGGESPESLWRDRDRTRDQYRAALDYALATVFSFAERRAGTAPLIVVLGDHQPADFVTGDVGGRDVPIHLIGPPELVARAADWGWTEGLRPAADVPPWPMEAFRDRFLTAFGPANPGH